MKQLSFNEMYHLENLKLTVKRIGLGENVNLNFHDHDFSEIVVIAQTDGNAVHWCNGKSYLLKQGDVLIMHKGFPHAYENTEGLELINIIYDPSLLPLPRLDGSNLKFFTALIDDSFHPEEPEKPIISLEHDQFLEFDEHVKKMEEEIRKDKPGCRLCVFGLFLAALVYIARAGGAVEQEHFESSAARAMYYLNIHFLEQVNVDFLSRMCNMSRSGFFAAFRELTGYTPMEYQREKRLKLAELLVRSSDKTLGEIAGECGFYDSNHLCRLFSRRYGISPGKLRREK